MTETIGLTLPERSKPIKSSFDFRSKNVDVWIDSLPRASVGRCAELIFNLLKEVNKLDIRYKDRIYLLESLREPVQYVAQAMKKHFVGARFPLPKKGQNVAHATRKIYDLMAVGYKISVEDQLKSTLFLTDKSLLSCNIHRAVTYLSRVLLTGYQVYAPHEKKIWFDLHQLYYYSEQQKLSKILISDVQHQYIRKTTITGEYLRILLLSLAAPNRLRHGEVDHVYVNLERWMKLIDIDKVSEIENNLYDFAIDINSDNPPSYYALFREINDEDNIRVFSTKELTQELYDELQMSEEIVSKTLVTIKMPGAKLSHDLIRRLMLSWGMMQERKHKRIRNNSTVIITLGLSAIHQVISKDYLNNMPCSLLDVDNINEQMSNASEFDVKDTKRTITATENVRDIWDSVYEQTVYEYKEQEIDDNTSKVIHYEHSQDWVLVDYSEKGFKLLNRDENSNNVQVGEMLGIKPHSGDDKKKWQVGIIRWMRTIGKKGVEVGGEILGTAAIPVGLSILADTEMEKIQRGLLLPEIKSQHQENSLITFLSDYRVGALINIHINNSKLSVRLVAENDEIGIYDQYQYELVSAKRTETTAKQTPPKSEGKDFDDVWSLL